ncbi:MAG TPA: Gfo/Idh/MocA family oxidoreductase [Burkholderiales bacterium]|nr:Gfo/Idh/MocA family oxidoreductase [Burkholderiales bacterium]
MTKTVRIGLIGSGFMGKAHAWGYRNVGAVFRMPVQPVLELLADATPELAASAARDLGFARSTGNWRELIADPKIDIVNITTPPQLHAEMALAAAAAGKHVYCEKPMAANAAVAKQMLDAAEKAGVKTQMGFNYLKNPIIALAREIIASGEIGDIVSFRGIHAEDYMADASTPWHWRLDPAIGGGVVQDLGSHIIAMARHLVGPIAELCGQLETVVKKRPVAAGSSETRPVEVDDIARAMVRFARGCSGTLEASWVSSGRKMQIEFEVVGSKGALHFNQERFNELRLYDSSATSSRNGFRTILAGPEHPPYGAFCPAPGHQLGFNDLKTIEVRDFLLAVAGEPVVGPDFREGWEVQKVVDAIGRSSRERGWVAVD